MSIKVVLYYAEWCGYCQSFKPEWEKLKTEMGNNIVFEEYEADTDPDKIPQDISGYPTIRITKDGKEENYKGKRTAKDIQDYLSGKPLQNAGDCTNEIRYNQCGAGMYQFENIDRYEKGFYKYKAKYMKAKADLLRLRMEIQKYRRV